MEGSSSELARTHEGPGTVIPSDDDLWKDDAPEISVLTLLNVVLRNRHLVLGLSLLGLLLSAGFAVFLGREYTAEARFVPTQLSQEEPRLGQLAAQLGMGGIVGSTSSVDFYAELLTSRDLLAEVVTTEYEFVVDEVTGETMRGTLLDLFPAKGETPDARLQSAVGLLSDRIDISIHSRSGLVTVTNRAPWRGLAVEVNRRLLELLDGFNRERRQSNIGAERVFIEARLGEAEAELADAEASLERFLEENRGFQTSPRLIFESARLERHLDMQQTRYLDLAQAYEQARIEEVRNTPVITIVDASKPAGRESRRRQALLVILGVALGATVAVAIGFGREYLAWLRSTRPGEYAEFEDLRRTAAKEWAPRGVVARLRAGEGGSPPSEGPSVGSGGGDSRDDRH